MDIIGMSALQHDIAYEIVLEYSEYSAYALEHEFVRFGLARARVAADDDRLVASRQHLL